MRNETNVKVVHRKHKWQIFDVVTAVLLTLIAVIIFVPFWNAVVISFETTAAYGRNAFAMLPGEFTLDNYLYLLKSANGLVGAYKSTIGITVVGTALAMLIMVMAAYAFSRQFPGKKFFFMYMVFTMFFGGGLIPTYLMIKNMHLLNTYTAVVLLGLVSAYNIIIMKNGFESSPPALHDAAVIDGATEMQTFWKVMLPLQKPLLATFALFTAVGYWNTWYWPLLLFNGNDKTVLQLFLRSLVNNMSYMNHSKASMTADMTSSFSQGIKMAAVFVTMLPIMLVYPFLQKYFVKGIMVGAVKM